GFGQVFHVHAAIVMNAIAMSVGPRNRRITTPSPRYSGERGARRGKTRSADFLSRARMRPPFVSTRTQPLSPALSPEYREEGVGGHAVAAIRRCACETDVRSITVHTAAAKVIPPATRYGPT